jgi:hypothetical protein
MERGDQEHYAERENSDPLENTQRTGLQVHDELRVVRVRQQADAGQEPEEVT